MKTLFWTLGILLLALLGFYALNSYIYTEKQAEESVGFQDGKYLGFIHAVVDNNTAIDFDDATWLSGVEGQNAAIEAGLCTEETRKECLPNDYFIQNENVRDERVPIDPNVLVYMQTWRMEETGKVASREIGLADFAALINDPSLHWRNLPYEITIANEEVVRIEEVYIP